MMHFPHTHFVASAAMPTERTVFHADGSRSVVGSLGVCHYATDGTVTFEGHGIAAEDPRRDHTRWDLAA